jgi:hypothetical protein
MPEPLSIITLVTVIITGVTQFVQIVLDYRLASKQGHSDLYKVYQSECCNFSCCTTEDSDGGPEGRGCGSV